MPRTAAGFVATTLITFPIRMCGEQDLADGLKKRWTLGHVRVDRRLAGVVDTARLFFERWACRRGARGVGTNQPTALVDALFAFECHTGVRQQARTSGIINSQRPSRWRREWFFAWAGGKGRRTTRVTDRPRDPPDFQYCAGAQGAGAKSTPSRSNFRSGARSRVWRAQMMLLLKQPDSRVALTTGLSEKSDPPGRPIFLLSWSSAAPMRASSRPAASAMS